MDVNDRLIGRSKEKAQLYDCLASQRAEFVAVYGRRRVGKTFLVKQLLGERFDFYTTGVYQVSRSEQLKRWQIQLAKYSGKQLPRPKDWFEAFDQLQDYLEHRLDKENLVVFIDELPWLDTPRSNFIRALEVFWNSWASDQPNFKLIVCGSATTWMTNKLLGDKGGLHNRVTRPIHLAPFTLNEVKQYLVSRGMEWEQSETLETYMIMGGVPYYLSLLNPRQSLRQNVDELFFAENAPLSSEYEFLFSSLFSNSTLYRRIIEVISTKLKGLSRSEILSSLKLKDGGIITEALDNLEKCDFIRQYHAYGKRQKNSLYQLTDLYTLFYLRFVKDNHGLNANAWSNMPEGKRNSWAGYAFEQVVALHVPQVKQALGISGISCDVSSWQLTGEAQNAQIDLIIDRNDNVINLCEMKYSVGSFRLDKQYVEWMRQRRELFREHTQTRKTLHLTIVTPFGLSDGNHNAAIQSVVTLDDLLD